MTGEYADLFAKFVGSFEGTMSPAKAHAILLQSGLPKIVLAQIWKLSDYDQSDICSFSSL
jgi:hypothetical protein